MGNDFNQLAASGLACVRGDTTLFETLELSVDAGQVLQLAGANGSGKTSLLRILCGLSPPAAGSVTWNGTDISRCADDYGEQISYIGHRRGVCDDLSPLENLRFACALDGPKTLEDCRRALTTFGLDRRMHTPARLLSAGQVQRTALARLLVADTAVWLLDEPFTALDADGRALVEDTLTRHADAGGISVIATHQPLQHDSSRVITIPLESP